MRGCAIPLPGSGCFPRPSFSYLFIRSVTCSSVHLFSRQEVIPSCVPDDTALGPRDIKMNLGHSSGRLGTDIHKPPEDNVGVAIVTAWESEWTGHLATFSLFYISFRLPAGSLGITDMRIKFQHPLFCLHSVWKRQRQE